MEKDKTVKDGMFCVTSMTREIVHVHSSKEVLPVFGVLAVECEFMYMSGEATLKGTMKFTKDVPNSFDEAEEMIQAQLLSLYSLES